MVSVVLQKIFESDLEVNKNRKIEACVHKTLFSKDSASWREGQRGVNNLIYNWNHFMFVLLKKINFQRVTE